MNIQMFFPGDTLINNIFIEVELHFNKKKFPTNIEDVRLEFVFLFWTADFFVNR